MRTDSPWRRARLALLIAVVLAAPVTRAPADPLPHPIERVSLTDTGEQTNDGNWEASASADARFIEFASSATNIVAGDTNGAVDVFVRDREAGTTRRVSVATNGQEADSESYNAQISAGGRYVVFQSNATNLARRDRNNAPDIFVADLGTGAVQLVSASTPGSPGNRVSADPSISADGRYVLFVSYASNLVRQDRNGGPDLFLRDTVTGTTTRIFDCSCPGAESGDDVIPRARISNDGRYVLMSASQQLVPDDVNGTLDAYVFDRDTGSYTLVSRSTTGEPGNGPSSAPALDASGRIAAFSSHGTNLVPGDGNEDLDVFVRDLVTGVTTRVSTAPDGSDANGRSLEPKISPDGGKIAFSSSASNLVPGDSNGWRDVFVSTLGGPLRRASVGWDGAEPDSDSHVVAVTDTPAALFVSDATNLVEGDTNGVTDAFLNLSPLAPPPPPAVTTALDYRGVAAAPTGAAATVAARLSDGSTDEPVIGATVKFELASDDGVLASVEATTTDDAVASTELPLDVAPGAYRLIVSYAGDDSHLTATTEVAFEVTHRTVVLAFGGETVAYARNAVTLAAELTDDGAPVEGATISFELLGHPLSGTAVTGAMGTASIERPVDVPAGSYTVRATFGGTELLAPASIDVALEVLARPTSLRYDGTWEQVSGEPIGVRAFLADMNGTTGVSSRTVTFELSDGPGVVANGSAVTDARGDARTQLPGQPEGRYTVAARFAGDGSYAPSHVQSTLDITKHLTSIIFSGDDWAYYGDTARFSTILRDRSTNSDVPDMPLTLRLRGDDGVVWTRVVTTDGSGGVETLLDVNFAGGTYSLEAEFAGDEVYAPASASTAFEVVRRATMLSYEGGASINYGNMLPLRATLASPSGPFADAPVTFEVVKDGAAVQSVTAYTDDTGMAATNMTIAQPRGTYGIVAAFAGDAHHAGSAATEQLSVYVRGFEVRWDVPTFGKRHESATFGVTIADSWTAEPIQGIDVRFRFGDGLEQAMQTSADGVATTTVLLEDKPGNYAVSINMGDDLYYGRREGSWVFTISWPYSFSDRFNTGAVWLDPVADEIRFRIHEKFDIVRQDAGLVTTTLPDGSSVVSLAHREDDYMLQGEFWLDHWPFEAVAVTNGEAYTLVG